MRQGPYMNFQHQVKGGSSYMNNNNFMYGKGNPSGAYGKGGFMQYWAPQNQMMMNGGGAMKGYKGQKGSKGYGVNSMEEMVENPEMHEEPTMQEAEGVWALWGLHHEVEEEQPPRLVDSSDDEGFMVVEKKKKVKRVKTSKEFTNKNKFEDLRGVSCLIDEEAEDVEDIMMNIADKQDNGGWKKVVATVDSGSADHVAPEGEFSNIKMEPSEGSRKGRKYVAANGHKVPNLGQKKVPLLTDDGKQLVITWQVTKVVKPLLSVS